MNPPRAKSPAAPGRAGELLTSHLQHTLDAALAIARRIGTIPGTPPQFWTWVALAALLHDAGKIPYGFQRMIGNTVERSVVWGERHEVLSLGFVDLLLTGLPADQRLWVATAVAAHHRPLTSGPVPGRRSPLISQYGNDQAEHFADRFAPADQQQLHDLVSWLCRTGLSNGLPVDAQPPVSTFRQLTNRAHELFQHFMNRWEHPLLPGKTDDGRMAVLLLGAVTMADHLSSAHASLETRHPLDLGYPARLAERLAAEGHTLRPQQRQAETTSGNLLLRSWTGSGKTEAVLLWARRQLSDLAERTGGIPRVFYLLPYLASINAMTDRLGEELQAPDAIGVAHSKAASYHLARSLDDECPNGDDDDATAAQKAHSRAEATRNFRELLRVGTPYQLLRGALAGAVHSSILLDSANSVFVLDELHAYDARRLGMILAMLRLWHEFGGRVAVLSATLSDALAELVETAVGHVTLVEAPADSVPPIRHRLHTRSAHLTDDSSIAEIRSRLAAGQSVLVVANNVRDAIYLYEILAPECVGLHGQGSAHLLHSRFKRADRTAIEEAIRQRFEVGQPRRPGLLIGTQAVEVSLNLDLDACHTSAAYMEALIQRFGRVNRLASLEPAPVVVHEPRYGTRHRGGEVEWADGVYEAEPTQNAWKILCEHDGQTVDERMITVWLNDTYASEWGTRWKDDVTHFERTFRQAFLAFNHPFDDRAYLADDFDQLFDGTEAVLTTDIDRYRQELERTEDVKAARLYADQYLIPLPAWAGNLSQYEKTLKVRIIDAEYDDHKGLTAIHRGPHSYYNPGEVL